MPLRLRVTYTRFRISIQHMCPRFAIMIRRIDPPEQRRVRVRGSSSPLRWWENVSKIAVLGLLVKITLSRIAARDDPTWNRQRRNEFSYCYIEYTGYLRASKRNFLARVMSTEREIKENETAAREEWNRKTYRARALCWERIAALYIPESTY